MSLLKLLGRGIHGVENAVSQAVQKQPQQKLVGQAMQQFAPMGKLDAQGDTQWNPSMGGAPIQPQGNGLPPISNQVIGNSQAMPYEQGFDTPAQAAINTATQFGGTNAYNSPFIHYENDMYGGARIPQQNAYYNPNAQTAPLRNLFNR
jgi:hypothetical protein